MSIFREIEVDCPKCGRTCRGSVPESVNTRESPQERRRLLDGALFQIKCECGRTLAVDFPVLYHDPVGRVMIYYARGEEALQTERMFAGLKRDPAFAAQGYVCRVTTDQEALREKAMIFDAGMDDRVMEIIKLTYVLYMRRKRPNERIAGALFVCEEGRELLRTVGGASIESELSRELYDQMYEQYKPRLEREEGDRLRVDFDWAVHFLGYDRK